MKADFYGVKVSGAYVGYYASKEKAERIAQEEGGTICPFCIVSKA